MLILAGLLGMMALGSIVMLDFGEAEPESDDIDIADEESTTSDASSAQIGDTSNDLLSFIDEEGEMQTLPNETTAAGDLLIGSNGNDEISGAGGDDNVMAGGGDDAVSGDAGDDAIHGNGGADLLNGGTGFDALFGDQGDDHLSGGDGNDTLHGNAGSDQLHGGLGNDDLSAGEGDDALWGDAGDDTLVGSAGHDTLDGGEGRDVLFAGTGDDVLNGWEEGEDSADFLNGGTGDDTIFAGAGDEVSGGSGADTTVLSADIPEHAQIWDFESGQDTLVVLYEVGQTAPDISISADPDVQDQWLVQANGEIVAQVSGDVPHISDISLMQRA